VFTLFFDRTPDLCIARPDGTHLTQVTHAAFNGENLANRGTNP